MGILTGSLRAFKSGSDVEMLAFLGQTLSISTYYINIKKKKIINTIKASHKTHRKRLKNLILKTLNSSVVNKVHASVMVVNCS